MKKRIILILTSIFISTGSFVFSQNAVNTMNSHMEDFTTTLNNVIPNTLTGNNVYSNAWIGKFFPSLPMHFSIGVEGGLTKLDTSSLSEAGKMVQIKNIPNSLFFPTLALNAKIGGLFLPFDVGLSFMTLDSNKLNILKDSVDLNYFTIGGNVRYCIVKDKLLLPEVSVGVGYYYSKGDIGKSTSLYGVNVGYDTKVFLGEIQASKKIVFITPFIGFRAVFSKSESNYNWKAGGSGLDGVLNGSGSISHTYEDSFIPQVFGGVGIGLALFQLDINGSWDFANSIWNFGASFRFKL